ncbi:MAG TPA: peptidogalycan biosysnthesis protein, partial [Myxococcota bacterium]|nr:peptidogalycan biosysnthesis protein [Myxococcota bacterium]
MLSVEWGEGVRDVARDEWNRLVGDESPFLEWDWLASLEDAGVVGAERGWLPRPLLAREAGRLIAACPVYVKAHSEGEFVFDFAWAEAAARAGIRYYPKLLVGVPFTPVTGARFLIARGVERAALIARLGGALREACVGGDLSGVHVNFCREDEVAALAGSAGGVIGARAAGAGAHAVDARFPRADADGYLLRIGFQYHWRNAGYRSFADYLARFRSKRRNQIQRERRALEREGIAVEVLTGDRIGDELFEPMFACYLATIENRYWGRQYL